MFVKDVKECFNDYIRQSNPKSEDYSFENLDKILKKIEISNISPKSFTNLFVTHYINNRFIPIVEKKLLQQDLNELNLFKDLHTLFVIREKGGYTSHMHLAYKQNKVDKHLQVNITNEEEKYVYMMQKLSNSTMLEGVLNLVLSHLKTMLLSGDFTDFYNYRIARLICFICHQTEKFEYLRCLVYDLIAVKNVVMPLTFHKIIILFAREFFNFCF